MGMCKIVGASAVAPFTFSGFLRRIPSCTTRTSHAALKLVDGGGWRAVAAGAALLAHAGAVLFERLRGAEVESGWERHSMRHPAWREHATHSKNADLGSEAPGDVVCLLCVIVWCCST
jgi:hypothetical protein